MKSNTCELSNIDFVYTQYQGACAPFPYRNAYIDFSANQSEA